MRPYIPCVREYRSARVWKSFAKTDIFLTNSAGRWRHYRRVFGTLRNPSNMTRVTLWLLPGWPILI
jgi:hypothetical protein